MGAELPAGISREVVGRRPELRLLLSAIHRRKAVLLVGLPGVSKTTMLRALARHLGTEPDRFIDVTGDEQLTAQILVGTFDPALVLKGGYQPDYFMPGPLARAMLAGGILYVEELNRAPSGALNALMTALSEGYIEVPRFGRVEARPGFTVVGALNPLDDVGTARLSRGLADRFIVLELDYQPAEEELEIVRRRCGSERAAFQVFAIEICRESRRHPELRHGASVRAAIDFVDLLDSYDLDELDLDTVRRLACTAYAGKVRVRPTVTRSACAIVHELIALVLQRDYGDSFEALVELAGQAPSGNPAEPEGGGLSTSGEEAEVALDQGGQRAPPPGENDKDEIPGLARPGGSGEPGESRSVPMVERDLPPGPGPAKQDSIESLARHLRDLDEVLRRARELVLRPRGGAAVADGAQAGSWLTSRPLTQQGHSGLDLDATIDAFVSRSADMRAEDFRVLTRERQARNYVILIDHSGSMVGRKLEVGATLAAILAELSAAGRADYAVLAFDQAVLEIKPLGEERDAEEIVDRILRLPEGRATDLGEVLRLAAQLSERLPEATDVVLISDCMPTHGVRTFQGLARIARDIPSLYICFTDERSAAIQMFHGERQMNIYEWWARQWVGDDRFQEIADAEEVDRLVDLLAGGKQDGL